MTHDCDFDAAVVGAGAVGLAVSHALARRGLSVLVLEAASGIGQGVSSRNSEVVHAGLYYPTGSLRAKLCVEGRRLLYPFLETHGVAHEKCGKLIVAADESEIPRLAALADQGARNDVEGLEWLTGDEARALEPELSAVAAGLRGCEGGLGGGPAAGAQHPQQRGVLRPEPVDVQPGGGVGVGRGGRGSGGPGRQPLGRRAADALRITTSGRRRGGRSYARKSRGPLAGRPTKEGIRELTERSLAMAA